MESLAAQRSSAPASRSTRRLPFELLESKLLPPRGGGHSISRGRLLERLNASTQTPVVVVCAGPGYGKTTLLAQWLASRIHSPFAWVSVDAGDNDPVVLLTYIAVALDRISPIDPGVFEALASPGASIEAKVLPRVGAAVASLDHPVALVLDDAHAVENPRCIDAIVALAGHLPAGSQLALGTRDDSALPMGRLRTRAVCMELGPDDLRMEEDEARELLGLTGVEVTDADLRELVRRTEGWPAGLYLGALSARATRAVPAAVGTLTGSDPLVADFLRSEFLERLAPHHARFLRRTSLLERLSGPLCDAILGSSNSSSMLEALTRSNRFIVALDRERQWYRCHHLVREFLAAELASTEPGAVSSLRGRAFDWCAAHGHEAEAIRYGQAAEDVDRVAAAMERCVRRFSRVVAWRRSSSGSSGWRPAVSASITRRWR